MKRFVFILALAVLVFIGCNKTANHSAATATHTSDATGNVSIPAVRPTIITITYPDEEQKTLRLSKISMTLYGYHVVSDTNYGPYETFVCKRDIDNDIEQIDSKTITIRMIEKKNLSSSDAVMEYMKSLMPDYTNISLYTNLSDASGILNLYSVKNTNAYINIVCFADMWYRIESDQFLDPSEICNNYQIPDANTVSSKEEIACALSNKALVSTNYSHEKAFAYFEITQGIDGLKYNATLQKDADGNIVFDLKNSDGITLLENRAQVPFELSTAVAFLDVNQDGYLDVELETTEGVLNSDHVLYVWDTSAQTFVKVTCSEMLSEIGVRDGYLLNWQKESEEGGILQTLIWQGNTLVLQKQEPYEPQ